MAFAAQIGIINNVPEIAIPLLPGDAPVTVDLQAVFDRTYDTGPYHRRVRYGEVEPEPQLLAGEQEWARGLIASGKAP